jgi:uncharacterized membrane protein YiaA
VAPNPASKTSWVYRRTLIFGVALLCAGLLVYVVGWGADNELNRNIVFWSFLTLLLELAFYVFGATFEDLAMLKMVLPGAAGQIAAAVTQDRRATDRKGEA